MVARKISPAHRNDLFDHAIHEAIALCKTLQSDAAGDLKAILSDGMHERGIQGGIADKESLLPVLRAFVLIAMQIDEKRLGSILACVRYLSVETGIARRNSTKTH